MSQIKNATATQHPSHYWLPDTCKDSRFCGFRTIWPQTPSLEPTVQPVLPLLNTSPPISLRPDGIRRSIQLTTKPTEEPVYKITEYIVKSGDSPWSIAQKFELRPETILWGNPELNGAGSLKAGDQLSILPVDGVLHVAESGNIGNSTGKHQDFRILHNGVCLNPLSCLPE